MPVIRSSVRTAHARVLGSGRARAPQWVLGLSALALALVSASAAAATPDAGSLLRDLEQQRPSSALPTPGPQEAPAQTPAAATGKFSVLVSGFHITGATLLSASELKAAVQPIVDRRLARALRCCRRSRP